MSRNATAPPATAISRSRTRSARRRDSVLTSIDSPSTTPWPTANRRDPLAQTLEVLRLDNGRWAIVATFAEIATVRAEPFDALDWDLTQLWDEPPPVAERCPVSSPVRECIPRSRGWTDCAATC